ncbi:MAG: DUF3638 domain-containing protein, partial [Opitutales bacterium]|nr:DUF3638 domain-containing protein [Opitutales bacterium]
MACWEFLGDPRFFSGKNTYSVKAEDEIYNDQFGDLRNYTLKRLREHTHETRKDRFNYVVKGGFDGHGGVESNLEYHINELKSDLGGWHDFEELEDSIDGALGEIEYSSYGSEFQHSFSKSENESYKKTFETTNEKIRDYVYPTCKEFDIDNVVNNNGNIQTKVKDLTNADNNILDADWGEDCLSDFEKDDIPEQAKPGVAVEDCLKTLKELHKCGNNYAKAVANVVGYKNIDDGVCNDWLQDTTKTKWLKNPIKLAISGLADIQHLIRLNDALQMLRSNEYDSKEYSGPDKKSFIPKEINEKLENVGKQFAVYTHKDNIGAEICPVEHDYKFPKKRPFDPKNIYNLDLAKPKTEEDRNQMIVDQGYRNGASSLNNLLKCNVEDADNIGDRLMSVLAAIGNDPQSFANQLAEDKGIISQQGIGQLMRGLLTSSKARSLISNQVKTPQNAKMLADSCISFLNKTWFDSPTLRPFDPIDEKNQHILKYNTKRLDALLVCINSIAEVLTMFGQSDGISSSDKAKIDKIVQNSLENILDSLNQKVLFQNIESNDTDNAHKLIAQTILNLACQESKLLGNPANLSTKWHANVIASLAELGANNSTAGTEFSEFLCGEELRRFRANYIANFTSEELEQNEISYIGSAAEQIMKKWHQSCEKIPQGLAQNLRFRTTVDYENVNPQVEWNSDAKSFIIRDTSVICNLINGTSDVVKQNKNVGTTIYTLIGEDKNLRNEICAYLGIGENEALDVSEVSENKFRIKTLSGPHSKENFYIAPGKDAKNGGISRIFMREDGMQLTSLPDAKFHLFKRYFCFVASVPDSSSRYEFLERTGGQDVAYSALLRGGKLTFYKGLENNFTNKIIDRSKEVQFADFKSIPILKDLAGDNPRNDLEAIIYQENGTHVIEIPAFILYDKPVKLLEKDGEWVSADNPNMVLISREKFENDLNPAEGINPHSYVDPKTQKLKEPHILGGMKLSHIDNPMGNGTTGYLVFEQRGTNNTVENFRFILPEEIKDKDKISTFTKLDQESKLTKAAGYLPFGLFGKSEPRKINFNREQLTVQCSDLRWNKNNVGRSGEFTIPEVNSKTTMHSALIFATRALKEKNYDQTIGFLESIPGGLSLGNSREDESIKNLFFEIINDDFDRSPEAHALRMRFLFMWLQSDTKVDDFLTKKRSDDDHNTFRVKEIIQESSENYLRDRDYYSPRFVLSPLQRDALAEKAKNLTAISIYDAGSVSSTVNDEKMSLVPVITRKYQKPDVMSSGEIKAFEILRLHFSKLNAKPGPSVQENSLLEGENDNFTFTLLGNVEEPENMGPIAKSEFDRYKTEITEGRKKLLEERQFIPSDDKLIAIDDLNKKQGAIKESTSALKTIRNNARSELEKLYKKIFASQISNGTLPGKNMMPVLVELMLNREKPPLVDPKSVSNNDKTKLKLEFPAQNISIKIYHKDYNDFLAQARTYLLAKNMLVKNEAIEKEIKNVQELQKEYQDNPSDTIKTQLQAAHSAMNCDIAAQKALCEGEVGENLYGAVANAIGGGITRDELMIYESLSNIRPHVNQAELLRGLFAGDISAFQLIMGGGKTAVLISLFCFYVSRREKCSVPVILSHPSQFESITGNVAEYQRSRFNQGCVILDVNREQLKDVEQLKQILRTLREAKENRQVIIAKTSLLNMLQLTFQETCGELAKELLKDKELQDTSKLSERFYLLRDILSFFKNEAVGIFDEAHINFCVLTEVNFPSGDEKSLHQSQLESGYELFLYMADYNKENRRDLFRLGKNEQSLQTDREFYHDLESLSDHIFDQDIRLDMGSGYTQTWRQFLASQNITRNDFRQILFGTTIPENKNPFLDQELLSARAARKAKNARKVEKPLSVKELVFERLAIFRGMLQIMFYTRHSSANQNFGWAVQEISVRQQNGKVVTKLVPVFRPYVAVGQPSTNEFGNPFVKMVYYFMHAMHNEMVIEGQDTSLMFSQRSGAARLINMFFEEMQEKITQEELKSATKTKSEKDSLGKIFKDVTGLEFNEFANALSEYNENRTTQYNQCIRT